MAHHALLTAPQRSSLTGGIAVAAKAKKLQLI
jgi:hypothetical protein